MNTGAVTYTVRVRGHLDDHWSEWLGDAEITRDPGGSTTLIVECADQAQLHGVLCRLRDIAAVIEEVRLLSADRA